MKNKIKKILTSIKLFFIRLFCCCYKKHKEKTLLFDQKPSISKNYSNYDPENNRFFNSNIDYNNDDDDEEYNYKRFESISSGSSSSNSSNSNLLSNSLSSSTFDDSELFATIDDLDYNNNNKSSIV